MPTIWLVIDEITKRIELREFLNALPARFHVVEHITYIRLLRWVLPRTLYVIRDTGSNHEGHCIAKERTRIAKMDDIVEFGASAEKWRYCGRTTFWRTRDVRDVT